MKPRDEEHVVKGDRDSLRTHPNLRSLKGVLASKNGERMSFAEIHRAAARARVAKLKNEEY
jgi:hypothetical protein